MKLYVGGCVLKLKPDGEKSSTVLPLRTTVARTEQELESGSFVFVSPACALTVVVDEPHVSVRLPGEVRSTTAHRLSSVWAERQIYEGKW